VSPSSAVEGLIALLERHGSSDPGLRQVIRALRDTSQQVTEQFDHYQSLVEAVDAAQAARVVVNAARVAAKGWLAG
jgi:hypothetical protein